MKINPGEAVILLCRLVTQGYDKEERNMFNRLPIRVFQEVMRVLRGIAESHPGSRFCRLLLDLRRINNCEPVQAINRTSEGLSVPSSRSGSLFLRPNLNPRLLPIPASEPPPNARITESFVAGVIVMMDLVI
ncbi:hypothetical protein PGTUg99_000484 [Puccinia graminis f. sp. tritici]|uniref:Uncharacterized protein n=1 Tax=Puccinia graminis f. sp. tritici TaxID=56615 RepID=A0A5B0RUI4_PUCGR|nr:hypothetical protein PGTUg99_000484 [Puccinia graminis f. sp. tritici]